MILSELALFFELQTILSYGSIKFKLFLKGGKNCV